MLKINAATPKYEKPNRPLVFCLRMRDQLAAAVYSTHAAIPHAADHQPVPVSACESIQHSVAPAARPRLSPRSSPFGTVLILTFSAVYRQATGPMQCSGAWFREDVAGEALFRARPAPPGQSSSVGIAANLPTASPSTLITRLASPGSR
jgi:hypothetical protein